MNKVPTAAAIFVTYLSEKAKDTRGHAYVFESDGEYGGKAPDHFRLAECVFVDNGLDSDDVDVSDEVHANCEKAESMWEEVASVVTEADEEEPFSYATSAMGSPEEA